MSNISRRKFLKGAGAAALAVAATGVLAGCSKDDTPVIPQVTKEVKVVFMCDGKTVGVDGSVVVDKDATTVPVSKIKAEQIPQGYTVESTGELKIQEIDGKEAVCVTVSKIITTRPIKLTYVCNGVILNVTGSMAVDKDATTVLASAIPADQIPQGYTVESTGELAISDKDVVTVTLSKLATSRDVTVQFYNIDNNRFLSTTMIVHVANSQRFITKNDLTEALPGYEIVTDGNVEISENNRAIMNVKPVNATEQKEVTVYYYKQGSNDFITKATINVDMDVTFLYADELPNVSQEVWMGKDKYLMQVVPVGKGPFRINYLGNNKGEVKITANHKIIPA